MFLLNKCTGGNCWSLSEHLRGHDQSRKLWWIPHMFYSLSDCWICIFHDTKQFTARSYRGLFRSLAQNTKSNFQFWEQSYCFVISTGLIFGLWNLRSKLSAHYKFTMEWLIKLYLFLIQNLTEKGWFANVYIFASGAVREWSPTSCWLK